MNEQLTVKYPGASIYTLVCLSKVDHVVIGKKDVFLDEILKDVCEIFGEKITDVVSKCRKRRLVYCRNIYCVCARKLTFHSLREIGELIQSRDHTTVLNSISVSNDLIDAGDNEFIRMWRYFLSKTMLFRAENGETVRDIPKTYFKIRQNSKVKMTEKDIYEAVRLLKRGYDKKIVKNKFGVSMCTLNKKIRKYKSQIL